MDLYLRGEEVMEYESKGDSVRDLRERDASMGRGWEEGEGRATQRSMIAEALNLRKRDAVRVAIS